MLIPQVLDCNTQSLRVHISDQCFEWSRAFRNCLVSSFETIHVSRARSLRKSRPHVAIKSSNSYLSVDFIEKHAFSLRFHLPKQSEVRSVQGSPWLRSRAETFLGDLKSDPKPSGHRLGERRSEAIDSRGEAEAAQSALYNVSERSLRQAIIRDRSLGRVNSSMHLLFHGVLPLGGLVGGALGQAVGVRRALLIGALDFYFRRCGGFSPVRRLRAAPARPVKEIRGCSLFPREIKLSRYPTQVHRKETKNFQNKMSTKPRG